jgi:hypothetical protein
MDGSGDKDAMFGSVERVRSGFALMKSQLRRMYPKD